MRKTARVSFFIEFDSDTPPKVSFQNMDDARGQYVSVVVDNAVLIGTPETYEHVVPVSSISFDEINHAIRSMRERGGTFAEAMSLAMTHADSANMQKIVNEFWNLVCAHRPTN